MCLSKTQCLFYSVVIILQFILYSVYYYICFFQIKNLTIKMLKILNKNGMLSDISFRHFRQKSIFEGITPSKQLPIANF